MLNKLKFLMIVALLVSACSTPEDGETVTFNMAWLPQGSMSGVIVAIDQGFYSDVGLNVEAVRGFGGIRTVNEIDQGMFHFGYGDALAVILNRSNGGKTKLVGAINQDWPSGLCYITSRHNVQTPADLEGLTVGGGQASAMQVLVPEWLELNGVPRDAINLMQLDPAIVVNSLVEGQIDAGECWKANSMPIFHKRAAASDLEIDWIPYSAFGLDIYGNGIVTSEKLMEENPELVRQFLAATYRGYQWVHDNPDEATDIITSHYPVLDKEITRQQITELMELMSGGKSLGWLEEDKVSRTLDFLAGAYGVEEGMTVDDIYSTAFLDSGT